MDTPHALLVAGLKNRIFTTPAAGCYAPPALKFWSPLPYMWAPTGSVCAHGASYRVRYPNWAWYRTSALSRHCVGHKKSRSWTSGI